MYQQVTTVISYSPVNSDMSPILSGDWLMPFSGPTSTSPPIKPITVRQTPTNPITAIYTSVCIWQTSYFVYNLSTLLSYRFMTLVSTAPSSSTHTVPKRILKPLSSSSYPLRHPSEFSALKPASLSCFSDTDTMRHKTTHYCTTRSRNLASFQTYPNNAAAAPIPARLALDPYITV